MGKAFRLVMAAVLGVAVWGSYRISGYLSHLEGALEQNAAATQALVDTQKALRDQNGVLADMAVVTNTLSTGLDVVLERSRAIGAGLGAVGEANRGILTLNQSAAASNAAATRSMAQVLSALRDMNQSAASIRDYLGALRDTAASDVEALSAVGDNTARMNAKTPGW